MSWDTNGYESVQPKNFKVYNVNVYRKNSMMSINPAILDDNGVFFIHFGIALNQNEPQKGKSKYDHKKIPNIRLSTTEMGEMIHKLKLLLRDIAFDGTLLKRRSSPNEKGYIKMCSFIHNDNAFVVSFNQSKKFIIFSRKNLETKSSINVTFGDKNLNKLYGFVEELDSVYQATISNLVNKSLN